MIGFPKAVEQMRWSWVWLGAGESRRNPWRSGQRRRSRYSSGQSRRAAEFTAQRRRPPSSLARTGPAWSTWKSPRDWCQHPSSLGWPRAVSPSIQWRRVHGAKRSAPLHRAGNSAPCGPLGGALAFRASTALPEPDRRSFLPDPLPKRAHSPRRWGEDGTRMRRRPPLGTLLLLKAILVLASHIEGCGYQAEQPAPQIAESSGRSEDRVPAGLGRDSVQDGRHPLFFQCKQLESRCGSPESRRTS